MVQQKIRLWHDNHTRLKNEIADSKEMGRVQPFEGGNEGVQHGEGNHASKRISEVLGSYAFFEVEEALGHRECMDSDDDEERI